MGPSSERTPIIEPAAFDLIVVGTGLQESILAGAAAKAGKTVLHIDPAPHYGAHWATLTLDQFLEWAHKHADEQQQEGMGAPSTHATEQKTDRLQPGGMGVYSHVVIHAQPGAELGPSHQYSIDLAPKAVFCAGSLISALLRSGAHHSLEFKLIQASYVWSPGGAGGGGGLRPVPCSRAAVFRDRSLSPADKRVLMRFLANAAQAIQGEGALKDAFGEQPFAELLRREGLSPELAGFVLYALALLACDQEAPGPGSYSPVTARAGREALARYFAALGKYGEGTGALMVALYGEGELAQAFCRVAAVGGAMYILRCPLTAICVNPTTRHVSGIQLASDQELTCSRLVGNVDTLAPLLQPAASSTLAGVSRGVCILHGPLVEGESQTLVIIPPRALPAGNPNAIHVLQVGQSTKCTPDGRYLLYLCTPSSGAGAEADLQPALETLLQPPSQVEKPASSRPRALLKIYFCQATGSGGQTLLGDTAACCALPDAGIGFDEAVRGAERLFQRLFPDQDMFPAAAGDVARGDDDEESDEESVSALEAALGRLANTAPSSA